jgi:hypothetical protein
MKPASDLQTFACQFGGGATATLSVDIAALAAVPAAQRIPLPQACVTGRLRPAEWPLYFQWLAASYQTLADASGKAMATVCRQPDRTFLGIVCEPGQRPAFTHYPAPE